MLTTKDSISVDGRYQIYNDGNAVNLYGLEVFVGRDDGQYDNYAMRFCDGDGDDNLTIDMLSIGNCNFCKIHSTSSM